MLTAFPSHSGVLTIKQEILNSPTTTLTIITSCSYREANSTYLRAEYTVQTQSTLHAHIGLKKWYAPLHKHSKYVLQGFHIKITSSDIQFSCIVCFLTVVHVLFLPLWNLWAFEPSEVAVVVVVNIINHTQWVEDNVPTLCLEWWISVAACGSQGGRE